VSKSQTASFPVVRFKISGVEQAPRSGGFSKILNRDESFRARAAPLRENLLHQSVHQTVIGGSLMARGNHADSLHESALPAKGEVFMITSDILDSPGRHPRRQTRVAIAGGRRLKLPAVLRPRFGRLVSVALVPAVDGLDSHLWMLPWLTRSAGEKLFRLDKTPRGVALFQALSNAKDVDIDDRSRIVLPRRFHEELDFGRRGLLVYEVVAFTPEDRRNWNDGVLGIRLFPVGPRAQTAAPEFN
jgi:hypothetical protein